jgi:hypothetical protein
MTGVSGIMGGVKAITSAEASHKEEFDKLNSQRTEKYGAHSVLFDVNKNTSMSQLFGTKNIKPDLIPKNTWTKIEK